MPLRHLYNRNPADIDPNSDPELLTLSPILALTWIALCLKLYFCTNSVRFASRNKHRSTANQVSCLRVSVIFYVLNADSDRLADALISYAAVYIYLHCFVDCAHDLMSAWCILVCPTTFFQPSLCWFRGNSAFTDWDYDKTSRVNRLF